MRNFDIPVVIFIFKRKKILSIIERISIVKPKKLYIISDNGRNDEEKKMVSECRKLVENSINWDCEIIKNYAMENRGVYENIGIGAKWVLAREKWAIFLEDDNLPEVTFFEFCQKMLHKYENDTRILWICGTNYLGKYEQDNGYTYVFTKHMLPCGWASWSNKFNKFYDGDLKLCSDTSILNRVKKEYFDATLFEQYKENWMSEYNKIKNGEKPASWDYQMDFCIKSNNVYGICPCNNQIKNIGVDDDSIHGGTSFSNIMTKRFCSMESYPIEFPIKNPPLILTDLKFEKKIAKILKYPYTLRMKKNISRFIRKILNINENTRIKEIIHIRRENL
ncbi:MAG: glycosyltransferase family 2 protein [Bacilli bacterium]